MIYIDYNPIEKRATLLIRNNSNTFYAIVQFCRDHKFSYDMDNKVWMCSVSRMLDLIPALEEFDTVTIINEASFRSKVNEEKETKFVRSSLNSFYIKCPPVIGKFPYENYQLDYVKKGISQNRLAYFLGMGLGKTYITINVLNHLFNDKKITHALIVAPTEGIYNWKHELLLFNSFNLTSEDIYIANVKNRDPFN